MVIVCKSNAKSQWGSYCVFGVVVQYWGWALFCTKSKVVWQNYCGHLTFFVLVSNLGSSQKLLPNIFIFFHLNKCYLCLIGFVTRICHLVRFVLVLLPQFNLLKKPQNNNNKTNPKLNVLVVGCYNVFCYMVSYWTFKTPEFPYALLSWLSLSDSSIALNTCLMTL